MKLIKIEIYYDILLFFHQFLVERAVYEPCLYKQ